jgi:hypothetical protein
VDHRPLSKPDHLDKPSKEWLGQHTAGVIALALGVIAFIAVMVSQDQIWSTPDWRISVPGFVLTGIAAIFSIARREKASAFWLVGLGLAAAGLVLGWFLMLAIVIGATAVLILILHSVT